MRFGAPVRKPPPWTKTKIGVGSRRGLSRIDADFQETEFRYQNEVASRQASLLTGETALTTLARHTRNTAAQRGMKVIQGKLLNTAVLVAFMGSYMNDLEDKTRGYKHPDSPMMNVKVRRALSKAIDHSVQSSGIRQVACRG